MGCCASNPVDVGTSRGGTLNNKRSSAVSTGTNRRSSSISAPNVVYFEVGADNTMDDWYNCYDKAVSHQPDLFIKKVMSSAPPEVSHAISSCPQPEQLDLWKRYAFAKIPKEGLLTLDTIFLGITKQGDVMREQGLEMLRKKFGKLDNLAHFIYFMSVLSLCGRQEEFRQLSPSRARQNFKVDEWTLDLATWRSGWISLQVFSWKDAKEKVTKLTQTFDKFSLSSVELMSCVRFAYLFSKKDHSSGLMDKNNAITLWTALLGDKWELTAEWNNFVLRQWSRTEILPDQWDHVIGFAKQYPSKKSIQGYNPDASYWPIMMDTFAQHIQAIEGKDRGVSECNDDEGESNFDADDQRELP